MDPRVIARVTIPPANNYNSYGIIHINIIDHIVTLKRDFFARNQNTNFVCKIADVSHKELVFRWRNPLLSLHQSFFLQSMSVLQRKTKRSSNFNALFPLPKSSDCSPAALPASSRTNKLLEDTIDIANYQSVAEKLTKSGSWSEISVRFCSRIFTRNPWDSGYTLRKDPLNRQKLIFLQQNSSEQKCQQLTNLNGFWWCKLVGLSIHWRFWISLVLQNRSWIKLVMNDQSLHLWGSSAIETYAWWSH
jgi:hypothetical protein